MIIAWCSKVHEEEDFVISEITLRSLERFSFECRKILGNGFASVATRLADKTRATILSNQKFNQTKS